MATTKKSNGSKKASTGGKASAAKPKASKASAGSTLSVQDGHKAPAFAIPDASGATVKLTDLLGKKHLVLYFYPKDMTSGCTAEACGFRDSADEIRAANAQVVGISPDSPESHRKFIDKYGLNFPLLADTGNQVSRLYGVYKKKSLYGREYMGIERTTVIIDRSGVVRRVFPKVKVAGHTEQVLSALKELG